MQGRGQESVKNDPSSTNSGVMGSDSTIQQASAIRSEKYVQLRELDRAYGGGQWSLDRALWNTKHFYSKRSVLKFKNWFLKRLKSRQRRSCSSNNNFQSVQKTIKRDRVTKGDTTLIRGLPHWDICVAEIRMQQIQILNKQGRGESGEEKTP